MKVGPSVLAKNMLSFIGAVAQAQRKLEAAFARANPDLKMSMVGWEAGAGVVALKLYIQGNQAAPLDFVATAREALRVAVERVQPSTPDYNVGPQTAVAPGPRFDVVENEDENRGVYAPKRERDVRKPKAPAPVKKKLPAKRKKSLAARRVPSSRQAHFTIAL